MDRSSGGLSSLEWRAIQCWRAPCLDSLEPKGRPMKIAFRLSAVAALVLAGCPTPAPEPDTTPPTVARTVPDRDASGIATNAKLTIDFSEAMDPTTMNTMAIQL